MSEPDLGWDSLSDEEREREYSPSSCVGGDIGPFLRDYAEASEVARQWCRSEGLPIQTLSYGARTSQTIDVVIPRGSEPVPVVVFIHGGYWQELSKRESFAPAADFVSRGVAYAAVDYTLAPVATVEAIVTECRAAVDLLRTESSAMQIDPERVIVAGSSAGAQLAAMVALDPTTSTKPAGMVLLSGIYELEPLVGTSINDALGLDPQSAHENSPGRLPIDHPPAALVAFGDNETEQFKRQSRLFAEKLRGAGSPPGLLEVGGRNHFDIVGDLGREGTELGRAVAQLIEST